MCSPSKRVGLRRQARVEFTTDQQLDPWVKLADSPENQSYCFKTMSDHNGENEVNGTTSEATNDASEQSSSVRKGPPVAPKSARVRQSLRNIKAGRPVTEALKQPDSRNQDTGRTFGIGLRAASSGANLSIRQKISSFETFSNTEATERPSRRLVPTTSLPLVDKTAKTQTVDYSHAGRTKTVMSNLEINDNCQSLPTIPTSTQPPAEEKPSASPSSNIASDPHCAEEDKNSTSRSSNIISEPCEPIPVEEPTRDSVNIPKELPPVAETEQESIPSPEPSTHVPRRSSSSKEATAEKPPEGAGTHTVSLRTRSLPLGSSEAPNLGLEGESLGIILSFSNQVSSALMRSMQSLPQSPCVRFGNPWSAPPGSSLHNPTEQDSSTEKPTPSQTLENSERGFSVRYVSSPSLLSVKRCGTIALARFRLLGIIAFGYNHRDKSQQCQLLSC